MNDSGDLITVEIDLLIMEWDRYGGGGVVNLKKLMNIFLLQLFTGNDDVSIRAIYIQKKVISEGIYSTLCMYCLSLNTPCQRTEHVTVDKKIHNFDKKQIQ